MSRINLYELHARERIGAPPGWRVFRMECFPKDDETIYVAVTGAVCDAKKDNRETDWPKRDRTTERTVNLPVREHDEWVKAWELKTGKCSICAGTGQTFESWNHITGAKWRPCRACNATGNRNATVQQKEAK